VTPITGLTPRERNLFIQHRARMNANPHLFNQRVGNAVLSLCTLLSYAYKRPSFKLSFNKFKSSTVYLNGADPFDDLTPF
jgi:hypothetical protein